MRNNDAALVDRLIRAGADVKATNRYGISAIALACESGGAAIVERLIAAGISSNATGPYGETALHVIVGHVTKTPETRAWWLHSTSYEEVPLSIVSDNP